MTEHIGIIANTVSRLFGSDPAGDHANLQRGEFPARLWTAIDEAGLPLILAPESSGGAGLDFDAAAEITRMAGEHAAPAPLTEAILAHWLLGLSGLDATAGLLTVAILPAEKRPELTETGGAARLNGAMDRVPWARHADRIVLLADSTKGIAVVSAPGGSVTAQADNLAREPRDRVEFRDVAVDAADWARLPPDIDAETILQRAALLRAAQMSGAMERAVELTRSYAAARSQFGRALIQFQAIQHQLAVMAGQVAACRVAVGTAAARADKTTASFDIAVAKARVSEAAALVAAIAHQVHGAMGYTEEYGLHRLTARLWSWRDDYGDERFWQERLGESALASEAGGVWEMMTAGHDQ